MKNSKILFFLFLSFIFLNILDYITALFILPGESNILYLLTGSSLSILFIKILIIGVAGYVYFKNEYPSHFWHFSYIYILLIGCLLLSFGIYSNILGILNPHIVEQASQLSTTQKTGYYINILTILFIIPYIISMVAFKLYEITQKKVRYKDGS